MDHSSSKSPERAGARRIRRRLPTMGNWLVFLVVGFFLGPLGVSNLWGYLQTRRHLTDAAFRNIRNVAALEAAEAAEFVGAAEHLIPSIVAGNQHLFGLVRHLARGPDAVTHEQLSQELEAHLSAKVKESRSAEEFLVVSHAGILLASSLGSQRGADLRSSPCFQQVRDRARIVGFEYPDDESEAHPHGHAAPDAHAHEADPGPGEAHGDHEVDEPELLVTAPIVDRGDFLGVFCGRFGFDIHRSMLVAHQERTPGATIYLVDEKGAVVCGSFEDLDQAPFGTTLPAWERVIRKQEESWGRFRLESGVEAMLAYAPIPALGWGVVVEVPVSKALAELERLKWQAVAASGALVAVVMLVAFLIWREVVNPVKALSQTSDRMVSGAPGETVVPRGPREIVELAIAFNRMSLALRDSQETLELRIADRTRELRESREFLELLLDSIDQRVIVANAEHEIIKENRAAVRMHGRSLVGHRSYQVFEGLREPPDDYPARLTFATSRPASGERSQRTVRGLEPVYLETYPILDAQGKVDSVVEIARVITAEKQLQMKMAYQEKMAAFGQLAAGMAHEIGNPLAAIESQLRMAQGHPDRADKTLAVVRREVGRMGRMLREMVGFARRRRDEVILASANQVVEDVCRLLEHDPRARTVTVVRQLAENLPGIRTKEDYLVQILLNLGLNALDAMGEKGTLVFETGVEGDEVTIRVHDAGTGISDGDRAHLFEPFFTTKGPSRGTGLGLFVSRSIVEEMGGRLELEHTGPAGTTFVVGLQAERARSSASLAVS